MSVTTLSFTPALQKYVVVTMHAWATIILQQSTMSSDMEVLTLI